MNKRIDNKWHQGGIYFLLIFSVFVISCSGNEKKNLREIKVDSKVNTNSNSETEWVDPLFFIDGQLAAWVRKIYQDKSGNLWFGTNHYGVMLYNGDTLEYFSEQDGLGIGRITGILEDREGNVWFGTAGGLTKYDPTAEQTGSNSFTNFNEKDGLINSEVWSLIIDSKGIFWVGTMEGVFQYDGKKFTPFPIQKAQVKDTTTMLSYNRISSILEDEKGNFWFGTDGFGITKYNPSLEKAGGKAFTHITVEDGLCDNNISSIAEDNNGNIWIGTMYGGLCRYDMSAGQAGGNAFTNFTKDGAINGKEVYGIYEDKKGNIWFPSEGYGVYQYDGKSFTNFHENEGLNSNGLHCILEDKEGRFWLGGWGGLFRYDVSLEQAGMKSFFSVTQDGPWGE